MDIYCKLSKCIGQTPCSYEHYLVNNNITKTKPLHECDLKCLFLLSFTTRIKSQTTFDLIVNVGLKHLQDIAA